MRPLRSVYLLVLALGTVLGRGSSAPIRQRASRAVYLHKDWQIQSSLRLRPAGGNFLGRL